MLTFQLFIATLIVSHLFLLFAIAARITCCHTYKDIWVDDVMAAFTGCGVVFTLIVLLRMIMFLPDLRPTEYHLVLVGFIFIIWASRACLVMATGRLLHFTHRPKLLHIFWSASNLILIFGLSATFIAAFFCLEESICSEANPCFCVLAPELVLCTLFTNIVVDFAMVYTTSCIYMLDDFKEDPTRDGVFYVGLATSVCTFASSLAFWALYNVFRSHNYMLLLYLANAVACGSVLSSNALAVVKFVYSHKRHFSTGRGAQEASRGRGTVVWQDLNDPLQPMAFRASLESGSSLYEDHQANITTVAKRDWSV